MRKIISITFWLLLIIFLFCWDIVTDNQALLNSYNLQADALNEQIEITRQWNAEHNGVYVKINEKTPPNKYLKDSLRDVETINGLKLTKLNPAYMTRQLAELNNKQSNIKVKLTSLKPLNPNNKPDSIEEIILHEFEKGRKEYFELNLEAKYFIHIKPLYIKEACLNCHGHQGYKIGDVRGAIKVIVPATTYLSEKRIHLVKNITFYILIFLLGFSLISYIFRMSKKHSKVLNDQNILLNSKNEELYKTIELKKKIISIIGHDLRSPLISINGFSKILRTNVLNEKDEKIISYIKESSSTTLKLLEDIVFWSKAETGMINCNPQKFFLDNIIDQITTLFIADLNRKKIIIVKKFENLELFCDINIAKTVIRNLISNAIKYSYENSCIDIDYQSDQSNHIISVKDYGVGMSDEYVKNIFVLNNKASKPGTANEKGTGFGLLISYELIKACNGVLYCKSEVGKGTTFYCSVLKK